jgi:4-hydroxybenzoate polyprenyltransferase
MAIGEFTAYTATMTELTHDQATDIRDESWVDRLAPRIMRPYFRLARLDRPIGTWLLLLPCWWSLALASPSWPNIYAIALFGIGAVVMRGAGCTVNDLADRNYDSKVARTALRPIPSGDVSIFQAFLYLGLLCLIGLTILLQFNTFTIGLGALSLSLVVTYPFMKRITYWPQAVLGLTFNWGALMGWASVHGELAPAPVVMYATGLFWTLGYDTIYAHQDKEDDVLIGVKSTALRFGNQTRRWLVGFYILTIMGLGLSGHLAGLGWPFHVALAIGTGHLVWQVRTLDTEAPKNCLRRFKSNRDFGLIIFAGIVASKVML